MALKVAEPDIEASRAAQNALLPHDQFGRLLPLHCSLDCFKCFGSGVYCMRIWRLNAGDVLQHTQQWL